MVTKTPNIDDGALYQSPAIKTATESDVDQVVAAVVLAFATDPMARWVYPDPHQFLSSFPDIVRAFGGKAFEHGTAHYVDGFTGAALWLPPGVGPDEDRLSTALLRTVSEGMGEEMSAVLEQMGSFHPTEPHWYLPLIGVDPAFQGRGYGSALLRRALESCDDNRQLAYLESSNPRNLSLYERAGFKPMGEIQAGSSPTMVPMLRSPQ